MEDGREFDRDVAATDYQRAPGQALEVERLVRGDRELAARDVGLLRPGAGGDENVFCGKGFAVNLDFILSADESLAAENGDTGVHQNSLVDAVQAIDLAVLVGEELRPIEARLGGAPAKIGRVLQVGAEMCRVGKELFRDAADVDAGAAEAAGLGDRDAGAE